MVKNGMYKLTAEKSNHRYYDLQRAFVCKVPTTGCTVPGKVDINHIINRIPGITLSSEATIFEGSITSNTLASYHFTILRCSSIENLRVAIETISKLNNMYKPERIIAWLQNTALIDDNIGKYKKAHIIDLPSDKKGEVCWIFGLDKASVTKFGAFV